MTNKDKFFGILDKAISSPSEKQKRKFGGYSGKKIRFNIDVGKGREYLARKK